MGHQVPPPLPGAVLAEMASAIVNNGMAVYEMGPASVPIELAVIDWMSAQLGLPAGAGGVLTSGGSVGNLTALLAMRQARAGFDAWSAGAPGGPQLAVIAANEAHYSVARTVRVMGMGDAGAIAAPVDAAHRPDRGCRRARTRRRRRSQGDRRRVRGGLDGHRRVRSARRHRRPVRGERSLAPCRCRARRRPRSVDEARRQALRGIARADSVVWDAHKMLMMPALVTAVLFKRGGDAYAAFAQRASYLFEAGAAEDTWWDLGQRTLECTKRAMAVELWAALRAHGEAWFGAVIDRQIELAQALAARVAAAADFELALPPEANIVCFRPRDSTLDMRELRRRIIEDGRFYITGTELAGSYWLRATLMNPARAAVGSRRHARSRARRMPRITISRAAGEEPLVAEVAVGDSLFEAGARVSAGIDTACVGKGTCGLCRVKIITGAEHLTPYTDEERKHLGNVYHLTKVRLACRSKVAGDVSFEVVRKRVR